MSLPVGSQDAVLQINNLSVRFKTHDGEIQAVKGLTLGVSPGECLGVVGESGSGKSQTFLAAMGLLSANGDASGSVRLEGQELLGAKPGLLRRVRGSKMSMVFQNPMTALTPQMRIGDQIAETLTAHLGLSGAEAMERTADWLGRVRISDPSRRLRQYPHELSGGMRQRVMIAAALACGPKLVIADEPTTALDVTVQAEILDLMAELMAETGAALVLISHDMGVIARMASRVLVMKDGVGVETGSAHDIFERARHPYTQALIAAARPNGAASPGPRSELTQADAPPLLEVKDLRVWFKLGGGFLQKSETLRAVDGVDLQLRAGETLGVVGESGSGKSTLARAILRLITPAGGKVRFMGADLVGAAPDALRQQRRRMQIVFQDPTASLDPRMTLGQSVSEPLLIHRPELARVERMALAEEMLQRTGLSSAMINRYPHEISGGQAQRAAIARAMILQPKLLVCDEATSALDVTVRSQIIELLLEMQTALGLSMIFISHDLAVVRRLSHRVMVLYLGRTVEEGPAEALYQDPIHPYTKALLNASLGLDLMAAARKQIPTGMEPLGVLNPLAGLRFLPSRLPTHPDEEVYRPRLLEVSPARRVAEFDPPATE